MLDRYQKNRERMQNKPKDEPEPAVEENESSDETQGSSENKTEAETETDVIEHALQKRRNRRPLWQRFLIKMVLVIVQVIAIACFFEFANYVMAHYG